MFHTPAQHNTRNPAGQFFPNDDDDRRDQHDEPRHFSLEALVQAIEQINPEEVEQFTDEVDHAY